MKQQPASSEQGAGRSLVPVRGTQSFVGVMAEVFRRPSLTGLEVLWRWIFWAAVLPWPAHWLIGSGTDLIQAFQRGGFGAFGGKLATVSLQVRAFAEKNVGLELAALVLWLIVAAAGRMLVLRRADRALRPHFGPMLLLSALRWLAWALVMGVWTAGLFACLRVFVFKPQAFGAEALWVPFCGATIAGTLLLFVLWLGLSWPPSLAALYHAQGRTLGESLRAATQRGLLAGKLAEINLVLGIVKIALIVLAMVFSACPLPFETVETQAFLVTWTAGVLLLYFAASDYFHVVRLLAFQRMALAFPATVPAAPGSKAAS